MQHEDAENIGYVIPTPVMEHFINDYERNGHYTAFPALGVEWQKMESPFMRKALGMQVCSDRTPTYFPSSSFDRAEESPSLSWKAF